MNKFEKFKKALSSEYSENIILNLSPSSSFRNRCEFSYSNNAYVMHNNDQKIYMNTFSFASSAIQKKMPNLLEILNSSKIIKNKLFQINFRSNRENDVLVTLIYHKKIDTLLIEAINDVSKKINIKFIIRSKNYIHIFDEELFEDKLKFKDLKIYQTDNCFFQPNRYLFNRMIAKVIDIIEEPKDLLELYCGVGTFTLPLSYVFNKVLATENNRKADKCLKKGILENKISNINSVRLSSDEVVELFDGRIFRRMKDIDLSLYNFSHILIDPPRSGLTNDIIDLLRLFKNIIYISCNPDSYLRDLTMLSDYEIKKIEVFDQFPNTDHLEIVSILTKKNY